MATTPTPQQKTNPIGLTVLDYRGGKTTLCAGCGHNAISERITEAFYEMGIVPERVAKLSGIGCSSKSPSTPCTAACHRSPPALPLRTRS
jgi:2-oxoglutarate ferredoxin oxidoreductase subunit beta